MPLFRQKTHPHKRQTPSLRVCIFVWMMQDLTVLLCVFVRFMTQKRVCYLLTSKSSLFLHLIKIETLSATCKFLTRSSAWSSFLLRSLCALLLAVLLNASFTRSCDSQTRARYFLTSNHRSITYTLWCITLVRPSVFVYLLSSARLCFMQRDFCCQKEPSPCSLQTLRYFSVSNVVIGDGNSLTGYDSLLFLSYIFNLYVTGRDTVTIILEENLIHELKTKTRFAISSLWIF